MSDLDWIVEARRHIGMREIVGLAHNPKILEMLRKMGGFSGEHKAWWAEDETALENSIPHHAKLQLIYRISTTCITCYVGFSQYSNGEMYRHQYRGFHHLIYLPQSSNS